MTTNNKPKKIRVCTLNLQNYAQPPLAFYEHDNIYSNAHWQAKQQWISQQLDKLNPDIIGFQEVFSPDALRQLCADLGYQHFATVDQPGRNDYTFDRPVLALASRYPIEQSQAVQLHAQSIKQFKLPSQFRFSRLPIRATISIPGFCRCLIYVVHLKSQRHHIDQQHASASQQQIDSTAAVWAATMQRGCEAAMLYQDIVLTIASTQQPVIVMGDFNDALHSTTLQHLLAETTDDKFALFDAYQLQQNNSGKLRPFTHYFGSKGNVLDYILLSREFHLDYQYNLAEVTHYRVTDGHLINPNFKTDAQSSDHALVSIDLEPRQ